MISDPSILVLHQVVSDVACGRREIGLLLFSPSSPLLPSLIYTRNLLLRQGREYLTTFQDGHQGMAVCEEANIVLTYYTAVYCWCRR